jgi:hypothetical protein
MRVFKHIQFADGINLSLADFKKTYAAHLIRLSESEVKQAHKVATKGNGKLSNSSNSSKKANTSKDK